MSDTLDTRSVQLPKFDGKNESFELFWPKFMAYANLKGFGNMITTVRHPDLPDDKK